MLSSYLNQTAEYSKKSGTDSRGNVLYSEKVLIQCRKQKKVQNVVTESKQYVTPKHVYYLTDEVNEGDMLDGMTVAAVSEWVDISGDVIGYKAVM